MEHLKQNLMVRRIANLVHAHGGGIESVTGRLASEIALALGTDDLERVTRSIRGLVHQGVLHPTAYGAGVRLDPEWRKLMKAHDETEDEVGAAQVFADTEEDEDDDPFGEEAERTGPWLDDDDDDDDDDTDEEEDTFNLLEPEPDEDEEDDVEEDDEIAMGRAVIRAAAEALQKVEEAEHLAGKYADLAEENNKLRARVEELEREVRKLGGELKKRAGNTIGARLSGQERQAMTRLMKDLSRRAQ